MCEDTEDCTWTLRARVIEEHNTFHIRVYNIEHTCAPTYEVGNATSTYLATRFLDWFRTDEGRSIEGFRLDVEGVLGVDITYDQARRGREKAMKLLQGDPDAQYIKLFDYAAELRRSNPGSTVLVDTREDGEFKFFYVCFAALKQGFRRCIPLIGVDGCH